jgi:hypothetical protein
MGSWCDYAECQKFCATLMGICLLNSGMAIELVLIVPTACYLHHDYSHDQEKYVKNASENTLRYGVYTNSAEAGTMIACSISTTAKYIHLSVPELTIRFVENL